ncbi:MAG: CopG family transcriptional regulator [Thermofilum sp.]|nr:CopG family transcriptional regulator [Thermofilum sp.]
MSAVSVRVPRELKDRMDAFRGVVNWSEEIRAFIERRVAELEQEKALEELERLIEKLPPAPRGLALKYVREDRDRG